MSNIKEYDSSQENGRQRLLLTPLNFSLRYADTWGVMARLKRISDNLTNDNCGFSWNLHEAMNPVFARTPGKSGVISADGNTPEAFKVPTVSSNAFSVTCWNRAVHVLNSRSSNVSDSSRVTEIQRRSKRDLTGGLLVTRKHHISQQMPFCRETSR